MVTKFFGGKGRTTFKKNDEGLKKKKTYEAEARQSQVWDILWKKAGKKDVGQRNTPCYEPRKKKRSSGAWKQKTD